MKPTIDYFLNEIKIAEKNLSDSQNSLAIAKLSSSQDVDTLKADVSRKKIELSLANATLHRFENGKMFYYKGTYLTLPNTSIQSVN